MEAYLDNSATTVCSEHVRDVVVKTMMEDYGNPSSKHMKGVEAEHYLKDAREIIAKSLKVNEKEIYFTSGGTESNNWALIGGAYAKRRAGKHHCRRAGGALRQKIQSLRGLHAALERDQTASGKKGG